MPTPPLYVRLTISIANATPNHHHHHELVRTLTTPTQRTRKSSRSFAWKRTNLSCEFCWTDLTWLNSPSVYFVIKLGKERENQIKICTWFGYDLGRLAEDTVYCSTDSLVARWGCLIAVNHFRFGAAEAPTTTLTGTRNHHLTCRTERLTDTTVRQDMRRQLTSQSVEIMCHLLWWGWHCDEETVEWTWSEWGSHFCLGVIVKCEWPGKIREAEECCDSIRRIPCVQWGCVSDGLSVVILESRVSC